MPSFGRSVGVVEADICQVACKISIYISSVASSDFRLEALT